jgi:hypothetical protein
MYLCIYVSRYCILCILSCTELLSNQNISHLIQVIDSVYTALEVVAADDAVVMVRICARRAFILRAGYSDWVGARQTLKQALTIIDDEIDEATCRGANEVDKVSVSCQFHTTPLCCSSQHSFFAHTCTFCEYGCLN